MLELQLTILPTLPSQFAYIEHDTVIDAARAHILVGVVALALAGSQAGEAEAALQLILGCCRGDVHLVAQHDEGHLQPQCRDQLCTRTAICSANGGMSTLLPNTMNRTSSYTVMVATILISLSTGMCTLLPSMANCICNCMHDMMQLQRMLCSKSQARQVPSHEAQVLADFVAAGGAAAQLWQRCGAWPVLSSAHNQKAKKPPKQNRPLL